MLDTNREYQSYSLHIERMYNDILDLRVTSSNLSSLHSVIGEYGVTETVSELVRSELDGVINLSNDNENVLEDIQESLEAINSTIKDVIRRMFDLIKRLVMNIKSNFKRIIDKNEFTLKKLKRFESVKFRSTGKYYFTMAISMDDKKSIISNQELENYHNKLASNICIFNQKMSKNTWVNTREELGFFVTKNVTPHILNLDMKKRGRKMFYDNSNISEFIQDCETNVEFSRVIYKKLLHIENLLKRIKLGEFGYEHPELDPVETLKNFNSLMYASYMYSVHVTLTYGKLLGQVVKK